MDRRLHGLHPHAARPRLLDARHCLHAEGDAVREALRRAQCCLSFTNEF
jgi:hypothetical protein